MKRIKEIDKMLNSLMKELKSEDILALIHSHLTDVTTFKEFNTNPDDNIKLDLLNEAGLYYFEIKLPTPSNNLDQCRLNMKSFWDSREIKDFINSPQIIKSRLEARTDFSGWIPLYLGKGEKLEQRINQHLNLKGSSKTYAMKLCNRHSKLKGCLFRFNTLYIKDLKETQIVITNIEEAIRHKLQPIVGKQ
jgi:hypothetical protein